MEMELGCEEECDLLFGVWFHHKNDILYPECNVFVRRDKNKARLRSIWKSLSPLLRFLDIFNNL